MKPLAIALVAGIVSWSALTIWAADFVRGMMR